MLSENFKAKRQYYQFKFLSTEKMQYKTRRNKHHEKKVELHWTHTQERKPRHYKGILKVQGKKKGRGRLTSTWQQNLE